MLFPMEYMKIRFCQIEDKPCQIDECQHLCLRSGLKTKFCPFIPHTVLSFEDSILFVNKLVITLTEFEIAMKQKKTTVSVFIDIDLNVLRYNQNVS